MTWRLWTSVLHRYVGFLCIGLTLVYAISGIAVNHIAQWNPSCRIERVETNISPVSGSPTDSSTVYMILARLNEQGKLESSFRPDPETLQLFVEGRSIINNLMSGVILPLFFLALYR